MAIKQKIHVKKGDTVEVISGKDAGKQGKVMSTYPREGKVIVQGVNIITKHMKPRGMGQQGGIVKQEGKLYASKVMLVCKKCNKKTRIGKKVLDDGTKVRYCKVCNETLND